MSPSVTRTGHFNLKIWPGCGVSVIGSPASSVRVSAVNGMPGAPTVRSSTGSPATSLFLWMKVAKPSASESVREVARYAFSLM